MDWDSESNEGRDRFVRPNLQHRVVLQHGHDSLSQQNRPICREDQTL